MRGHDDQLFRKHHLAGVGVMDGIDWHSAANYAGIGLIVMAAVGMGVCAILMASGWGP